MYFPEGLENTPFKNITVVFFDPVVEMYVIVLL